MINITIAAQIYIEVTCKCLYDDKHVDSICREPSFPGLPHFYLPFPLPCIIVNAKVKVGEAWQRGIQSKCQQVLFQAQVCNR